MGPYRFRKQFICHLFTRINLSSVLTILIRIFLDASLDPPYFFDRTEDGSLKMDIQGWTDGEGPLSILPLLQEDSDDEDDSDQEEEEENLN
jgi:hypothetical protein